MKLNRITTSILAIAVLAGTNLFAAQTNVHEKSNSNPVYLTYYGQVNSNGTVRTKRVNGYYKSNGTYVNSYYRS